MTKDTDSLDGYMLASLLKKRNNNATCLKTVGLISPGLDMLMYNSAHFNDHI